LIGRLEYNIFDFICNVPENGMILVPESLPLPYVIDFTGDCVNVMNPPIFEVRIWDSQVKERDHWSWMPKGQNAIEETHTMEELHYSID